MPEGRSALRLVNQSDRAEPEPDAVLRGGRRDVGHLLLRARPQAGAAPLLARLPVLILQPHHIFTRYLQPFSYTFQRVF